MFAIHMAGCYGITIEFFEKEMRGLKILEVSTREVQGRIPLTGIETVKNAIRVFARGGTKGANATQNKLAADGGGIALMLKTIVEDGQDDTFLTQMFAELDQAVAEGRNFHRSYDYDGVGSFFKTTIEVALVPGTEDTFLLQLNAAYVGDQVEEGLAAHLGIERGLWRSEVRLEIEPLKDRFAVDFETIMEALRGEELMFMYAGDVVVARFMEEAAKLYDGRPRLQLFDGKYEIWLSLDSVSVASHYDYKTDKVLWAGAGSVLSGPLSNRNEYVRDAEPEWATPTVVISVSPKQDATQSWRSLPTVDEDLKTMIREVAGSIASRMASVATAS